MSILEDYDRWARAYDGDWNITRDLDAQVIRQAFSGRHYRSIVELGCGTGKNTHFFAGIADKVFAADFSPGMLSVARDNVPHANVVFAQTDITEPWPVPAGSVDLIACSLVLQHIDVLSAVFTEASRVLTAEGILFLSELHPIKQYQGSMARYVWENEPRSIPAFNHHISHYVENAKATGLRLADLNEWWHADDVGRPPRLVAMRFTR